MSFIYTGYPGKKGVIWYTGKKGASENGSSNRGSFFFFNAQKNDSENKSWKTRGMVRNSGTYYISNIKKIRCVIHFKVFMAAEIQKLISKNGLFCLTLHKATFWIQGFLIIQGRNIGQKWTLKLGGKKPTTWTYQLLVHQKYDSPHRSNEFSFIWCSFGVEFFIHLVLSYSKNG